MKTLASFMLDMWRDLVDMPEVQDSEFEQIKQTEWSPRFEYFMRNRLIMGSIRYERFAQKRKKFEYDCAAEAIKRIELYKKDGNKEHLVDAANMCLLQFEFGPGEFKSIDDGEHAKRIET